MYEEISSKVNRPDIVKSLPTYVSWQAHLTSPIQRTSEIVSRASVNSINISAGNGHFVREYLPPGKEAASLFEGRVQGRALPLF